MRPTHISLLGKQGRKSSSGKWQMVWLFVPTATSSSALLVISSLPILHCEVLFGIKNSAATTSRTRYLSSLVQATASTKLGPTWLSQQPCFCWQSQWSHSVHIAWCKFSHTGLTQRGYTNAWALPRYLVYYTRRTLALFRDLILFSAIKLSFLLE